MDIRIDPESVYRDRLATALQGKTEVVCSCGRIDVLTETHVYEVKHVRMWKQAMGQALVYAAELGLTAAIALFGHIDIFQEEILRQAAMSLDVHILYFEDNGQQLSALYPLKREELWEPPDYRERVAQYYQKALDLQKAGERLADICQLRYGESIWSYEQWTSEGRWS